MLFGDVVRSRGNRVGRDGLAADVDRRPRPRPSPDDRLAAFEFTQGDEIQGLSTPGADPTLAVLRASLHAAAVPMRWVIAGALDPGHGPATQRSGTAAG